ncbi:hypothetical protein T265_08918 [Opisthorchis viverrini]|uniref:Uncharacterized protein n=1 Tax=Opisthorchis viverrini TaxID=6198 RepID=A0A074Z7N0_OPIVI|nr:hypothetical protein T265_08918 [Opisthorchis viverrini]KER23108.1 hypothetical protein T265_08918 [Opisthorchis viverrini]
MKMSRGGGCAIYSKCPVLPVLNPTVSEVTRFLLSTVCSSMSLSIMLFNARSLLPKIHNIRAILAIS